MPEEMDSLVGYIKLMGFEEVARQLNGFSAQMKGAADTTRQSLGASEKSVESYTKSVSSGIGSISGNLKGIFAAAGITVGLAAAIASLKSATAAAIEFDNQMDKVASRLSSSDFSKLGALGKGVGEMSVKFGEGTKGLTDGLTDIIDAGVPASEALGVLDNSVLLAKGHMADVSPVISSVTSILKGFKIEAEDSGRVVDVLAVTADRGRGPMEGLASTVGMLSPYARQAKFSLEETAAAVATLTREGIPLEKTGMGLRMMFQNIAEAQEKGILKATTLAGAIAELSRMQEKERNAIVGSDRTRSQYNILLQQSAQYSETAAEMTEKAGAAQEKWNRISGDAGHKLDSLKQAAIGFSRAIGEGVAVLLDSSGALEQLTGDTIALTDAIKSMAATDLGKIEDEIAGIQKEVQDSVKAYVAQKDAINSLISQYETLKGALTNLPEGSKEYLDTQAKLQEITGKIAEIVPEAVDAWDDYGVAISANTGYLRDFNDQQKDALVKTLELKQAQLELAASLGEDAYNKAIKKREELTEKIKEWRALEADPNRAFAENYSFGAGAVEDYAGKIKDAQKEIKQINADTAAYELTLNQLGATEDTLTAALSGEEGALEDVAKAADKATTSTKTVAEAVDTLAAAQKKHLDILGEINWSDYYSDQERLSGKTTDQIIADIDRLLDKYEKAGAQESKAYKELADLRVEYAQKGIEEQIKAEQEAAQRITDIWEGVNEDVKASMSDALGDMFTGDSDFEDALKSMGDRIKESFAHGFADALVEKSGFDLAFKNNMLDLGGFASSIFGGGGGGGGGLFGALSSGFKSVTDWLGITSSAATTTAGEMAGLSEGLAGVGETATVTGNTITYTGESMLAFPAAGSAAAEGMTTVTGAAGQTTGALNATAGAATKAAPALTKAGSGLAGLNLALPATGVYLAAITGQFGETAQKISLVGTEAAALTVALGPMGALIGGVAGTLAHFGHQVFGIGGQHITFEEQFSGYLKDLQEGTKTQEEVFRQLYLRTTNYANDFWGTQSDLLKQSYAERLAYYNKFAELKDSTGASLFSEEQLNKLKDALQLFDTVEERAAAAQRTASEVAREVFTTKVWETFKEVPYLLDEVGQVGPVFQQAFEEAQASGEDFTEVFKRKLMELPGISQQALDLILEAFGQTTSEITDEIETAAGGYRDMWAAAAEGISDAGSSADEFFKNVQNVSGMWLKGWDIDIHEALMQIPGMTAEVKDALMEELRGLKESGATDFQIAESFKESVTSALNDPSLRKEVDGVAEMLRNAFSGIEAEPMELGRLFDTTGLKAFVKQLSTVKGGWNGIIDSVQEFRAELEASGQTAESAGDDIYKHLRDSLSEIPGITQEMVQTMERLIRSGDWQVLVDVSERGLDDVLHDLRGIPSKINVGVTASEGRGVSPGAVLEGLVNRLLQMASPPSVGGSFTPTISAAASGSLAAFASSGSASGRGDKHYHITLTIPGGEFGDRQFWDNVVRNKIQPALDAIEARG